MLYRRLLNTHRSLALGKCSIFPLIDCKIEVDKDAFPDTVLVPRIFFEHEIAWAYISMYHIMLFMAIA